MLIFTNNYKLKQTSAVEDFSAVGILKYTISCS